MLSQKDRIASVGGQVLLVVHDEPDLVLAKMMHDLEIPYPILIDLKKESYRRWGLRRTTYGKSVLSPSLTLRFIKLLLGGERFIGFGKDILQLGGDFIIDPKGSISYAYIMKDSGDRPPVTLLIKQLERVAVKKGIDS